MVSRTRKKNKLIKIKYINKILKKIQNNFSRKNTTSNKYQDKMRMKVEAKEQIINSKYSSRIIANSHVVE
jgi:hypothetical protein